MTYCGAIGSVNVLEFMSTDLFDETQENPFLLTPAVPSTQSPSARQGSDDSPGKVGPSSPGRRWSLGDCGSSSVLELPLHDAQKTSLFTPEAASSDAYHYQTHQQQRAQEHVVFQHSLVSPAMSPKSRASVTFNLPKSILKRQSSYDSAASTAPSDLGDTFESTVDVNETELHKLLYSLARFSVASETPTDSSPERSRRHERRSYSINPPAAQSYQYHPERQYSVSQPTSPNPSLNHSSSLWMRDTPLSLENPPRSPSSATTSTQYMHQCHSTGRATLKSRRSRRAKPRSKSADHAGYDTDPGEQDGSDDDDDGSDYDNAGNFMTRSSGSVSFQTVKKLLRGGGSGSRASRIVQRAIPDLRRKSMGTVSSRLKVRHKFAQPTILTDAYHRVYVYLLRLVAECFSDRGVEPLVASRRLRASDLSGLLPLSPLGAR